MDAHERLDQRLYEQHMEDLEREEEEKNLPATPPAVVRQSNLQSPDVQEDGGSTKRKRDEEEETPGAPPEPEDGIEAGVITVHPLQAFVPLAIKLEPTTLHPYSTDYCLGSPEDAVPLGGAGMPVHTMFLLDLSPSMVQRYGTQPSGADALRKLVSADGLPKWFAAHGKDLGNVSMSIAGFSGTCGWVEDNHCRYEAYLSAAQVERRGHILHTSTTKEKVLDNVVDANNPEELKAYCAAWSAKVNKLDCADPSERDQGHGTNTDAAIRFAHAAMEQLCNEKGGVGMVFLCTDGCSTLGHTTASPLKGIIDEHTWGGNKPSAYGNRVQMHALMMGNAPNPAVLTQLLGTKGLVAYAPKNDNFQDTLEALFKPTLLAIRASPGTLDVVSMVTLFDEDGNAMSKTDITWFSQGLLVGDNFTASFGARVPNDFYDRVYQGSYPDLDAMRRMSAKVECWMAPSLNSIAQVHQKANSALWTPDSLREWLSKRGLQPAFSHNLPLHGGTWWAPEYLQRGALHDRVPIPGGGDKARIMAFGSPQPQELGPENACHTVDPRNKSGLFAWVAAKSALLDELNKELGCAKTHAESQNTASKYEAISVRSGHRGLSRRCVALRQASCTIAEEERVLEADSMNELLPMRSQTSASHYASAAMSQTTE
jgi:hypothetical protein